MYCKVHTLHKQGVTRVPHFILGNKLILFKGGAKR